ncbi:unnamed protein product [Caenorhabditis bovis]|uniref:Uncharacterized protein n=1 Tax=Caenorhabditis bovis TaxID=2654633 RepID=A0A8S1FFB9_9PELO|nr:unnamed protein product [Caenorhabditis bovis]
MNCLIVCVAILAAVAAFPRGAKLGERVELDLSSEKVKGFTRVFEDGKTQTWNLDGPNKGHWVDEKEKKIDSSNFEFKAPGTLIIKKVTKADAAQYDYIAVPVKFDLPPGVHVDPGMPTSVDLLIH